MQEQQPGSGYGASIAEVPVHESDAVRSITEKLGAELYIKTGIGRRFLVTINNPSGRPTLIALHL
jgi:hypothetical protein